MSKFKGLNASKEALGKLKKTKTDKLEVYSFFPCDKPDCECLGLITEEKKKMEQMGVSEREAYIEKVGHIKCSRDHKGMKRYKIICNDCGEIVGYLWATSYKLEDWCDFHYYQYLDKRGWHGCKTPNVSPVDGKLTIECCCGQDTRDFRLNKHLPANIAEGIEDTNKIGRDFGSSNSRFFVTLI
jgi:hypothetical protein